MPTLTQLAAFLDTLLGSDRFPSSDPNGIYHPADRPIQRLGLALQPCPQLREWIDRASLDALFLHRPWGLEAGLAEDLGILAYHLSFDERLTLGWNPDLAEALTMTSLEVLGYKDDRPIGMIGQVPPQCFQTICDRLHSVFDGVEAIYPSAVPSEAAVSRVAVVGAMTPDLVQQASDCGAQVYITGQFRQAAAKPVQQCGIGVVAIGHHRCEVWGLQLLARMISKSWPDLQVVLLHASEPR